MIPSRVVFFSVRDALSKLRCIVQTAKTHFEKKEHLLILVENEKAQKYVDDLLWKLPETGFLPHTATDSPSEDWIVITEVKKNLNKALIAFNLCPTPFLIEGPFRIIYDFEDLTAPNKKNLSALRFDAYKKARYLIEAR